MLIRLYLLLVITLLAGFSAYAVSAAPMSRDQVPEPLQEWVDWALYEQKELGCPWQYNAEQRACRWPSRLWLQLGEKGGSFSQQWQVFTETQVRLPGDQNNWPQRVSDDRGELLLVEEKDGFPQVTLPAGEHTISGEFLWQKLPKTLRITPESGLINLQVNGRAIKNPRFNAQHQLWLTQGEEEVASEDNLDLQVFRKIIDTHPLQVVTSIRLRVSGKQRNATLAPVLLDDFIALQLDSQLPARMSGQQQLQVQLRPGEWTIDVTGRSKTDRTEFTLPASQEPWPQQEVWVFEADSAMRQVEVQGVSSIDPNQTRLPEDWKRLPAYLLDPGQTLTLNTVQRGVAQTSKQQLNLQREMWLDFDGGGYTLKDQLRGQLGQQSRLDVLPILELGRVQINGQPQFITRKQEDAAAGVEIRSENINLQAESRYSGSRSELQVNGWQYDLQQVNTTLHLPPGWFLFSGSGTDNRPDSWVEDWSLLDLFLVLIIALATAYLYGWRWGAFALLALVFFWHQPGAPRFIWLNLLAVVALLRVLPEGWLRRWLGYYRWLSLLVLAMIVLPYLINTVRIGLYPQLAYGYSTAAQGEYTQASVANEMAEPVMEEAEDAVGADMNAMVQQAPAPQLKRQADKAISSLARPQPAPLPYKQKKYDMQAIDPNSMIQTGPGLPNWHSYRPVRLNWSGPVKADETSRLLLVGPKLNLLFKLAGIALLLVLCWRMLGLHKTELPRWKPGQWFKRGGTAVLATLLLPALFMVHEPLQAETIPDQQILQTLQQRLTAAPDCLPNCAQIERMQLGISGGVLMVRLSVHAAVDTALPLPGSQDTWLASDILLDQQLATAINRDAGQQLWLALPAGRHEVQLRGILPQRNSLPLPLQLKPHHVSLLSPLDKDWTVEGIRDDGTVAAQLQLNRVLSKTEQAQLEQEQSILPTFVKVERNLRLGLDWYVETTVRRISPLDTPLSLSVPLLPNEQPMSEQLSIRQQKVTVNLAAQQMQTSWSSRLNPGEQIVLTAADSADYLETWSVAASPVWHLEADGLPVSRFDSEDQQQVPVWQPWPGETLTLNITRPQGVPGQTVTILGSEMLISTGKRANDVDLQLNIRSSRGVQQVLTVPEGVEVQQLKIDGVGQRIQKTERELNLNLKPGQQQVQVQWRETEPLGWLYRFPEVDLGIASVNSHLQLSLPYDRWVLWTGGPLMGPAVLFWGVLLALFVLSLALGYSKLTPLKSWQWFLLGVGLSQTETTLMILVAGWLMALSLREKLNLNLKYWQFNAMQIALAGLTLIALLVLGGAVANGLLGQPEMQIAGNGSSAYSLQWYQDRSAEILAQPYVVSVPLWIYRALMLLWALWLAVAVLGWLRWGWQALNKGELWQSAPETPDQGLRNKPR
ncbi:MAG: MARVEL domain-containing protein [Thiolinea sp.]